MQRAPHAVSVRPRLCSGWGRARLARVRGGPPDPQQKSSEEHGRGFALCQAGSRDCTQPRDLSHHEDDIHLPLTHPAAEQAAQPVLAPVLAEEGWFAGSRLGWALPQRG